MKIVECQPLIQPCLEQFVLKMQWDLKPEVILLGKAATAVGGKRSAVFQICGADEFDYAATTKGEAVYGTRGAAVLLYPFAIKSKNEFEEVLYHELGHILSFRDNHELVMMLNKVKSAEEEHGDACLGSKLWLEFVAQAISNSVAAREPQSVTHVKQYELLEELSLGLPGISNKIEKGTELLIQNGIKVVPYNMAHYFALLLTDPTIEAMVRNKPECSYGFDLCSDEVAVCLDEIAVFLQEQLQKEHDWVVSEGFLAELATMIYEIWEIRTLEDMKYQKISD